MVCWFEVDALLDWTFSFSYPIQTKTSINLSSWKPLSCFSILTWRFLSSGRKSRSLWTCSWLVNFSSFYFKLLLIVRKRSVKVESFSFLWAGKWVELFLSLKAIIFDQVIISIINFPKRIIQKLSTCMSTKMVVIFGC